MQNKKGYYQIKTNNKFERDEYNYQTLPTGSRFFYFSISLIEKYKHPHTTLNNLKIIIHNHQYTYRLLKGVQLLEREWEEPKKPHPFHA